jgi:hypothetical protein
MYGTMDDAVSGEHNKMVKYVTRLTGPNSFVFEYYDLSRPGPDAKVGELVYTRKGM